MEGCHGSSDTEFRSNQADSADPPWSSTQQSHHGIKAEEATAPQPHHDSREHQAQGDQQGWFPQHLQLDKGCARQACTEHRADADFKRRSCPCRPCRGFQSPADAQDTRSEQGSSQRSCGDPAEQCKQPDGGAGQHVQRQCGQRWHRFRCGLRSDLEPPASMCCHRASVHLLP